MTSLKNEGKISLIFVLLGNPIGIFLFWVGMSVIPFEGTITIESFIKNLLIGIGGSPIAIIFGSLAGVPLSFANSIVFILLAKSKIGHKNLFVSGVLSGACIPAIMFTYSYFYDVHYLGLVRREELAMVVMILWLIISSSITGLILAKVLEREFNNVFRKNPA